MKKKEQLNSILDFEEAADRINADNMHGLYQNKEIIILDSLRELPEIENVMMDFFVAIHCHSGQIRLDIDGKTYTASEGNCFVCPRYSRVNNVWASLDFDGLAYCISRSFVNRMLLDNKELWARVDFITTHPLLILEERHKEFIEHFVQMMKRLTTFHSQPYYHASIEALIRSGLFFMIGLIPKNTIETKDVATGGDLFSRFTELVKSDQGHHRDIDYYASHLCVTSKYLSAMCKQRCGKSAKKIIEEQTIDTLRYLLLETNVPIKQIAADMLFPNLSFFGRYIVKHFGTSPTALRQ